MPEEITITSQGEWALILFDKLEEFYGQELDGDILFPKIANFLNKTNLRELNEGTILNKYLIHCNGIT